MNKPTMQLALRLPQVFDHGAQVASLVVGRIRVKSGDVVYEG